MPAARFVQRDGLRLRPRQSRSGIQHAAQRLRGRTERLFHKNILQMPGQHRGLLWLRRGAAGCSLYQKGRLKKKRRRLDRKIKTPPQKLRTFRTKGQLAGCLCRWQLPGPLPVLAVAVQSPESPCVDGRSSFFQIAAFLLREGGGVSPATLECRLIQPLALRRGVRSCFRKQCALLMETASIAGRFRHLCSKKLVYPVQIVMGRL